MLRKQGQQFFSNCFSSLQMCIKFTIFKLFEHKKTISKMNSISIGPHVTQLTSLGPHYRHALPISPPFTSRVSRNVHTHTSSSSNAGYLMLSETSNPQASNAGHEVCFNSEMKSG